MDDAAVMERSSYAMCHAVLGMEAGLPEDRVLNDEKQDCEGHNDVL